MQQAKYEIGAEAQRVSWRGRSSWVWQLGKDAKTGGLITARRWDPTDDLVEAVARVRAKGGVARITRNWPSERREMLALELGRLAGE
ncbi:MAG: hypothetical protein SGJ19_05160, partial [Planctomycetia bacterium]|nr:hypothetical protein [Planctomycetia bacterium]